VFCPKCGKELPEDAQFCLSCGQALTSDAVDRTSAKQARTSYWPLWVLLPILTVVMVWWSINQRGARRTNDPLSEKTITSSAPATGPTPTAAEMFHLRSECAQLGQKILNSSLVGVALTQDEVSHYDAKTNRCFVELTVHTADLSKPAEYYAAYLFDGQTGEMLASARMENNKKSGVIFGVPPPDGHDPDAFWNQATGFINGKMEDDRTN
jgi:predicted nucleic acid-binding Zn ribbon protein